MYKFSAMLALIFFVFCGSGYGAPSREAAAQATGRNERLAQMSAWLGDKQFQFSFVEIKHRRESLPGQGANIEDEWTSNVLKIECIQGCSDTQVVVQELYNCDQIYDIGQVSEISNLMIFQWPSGMHAYDLTIYGLRHGKITRVFNEATDYAPDIGVDAQGEPVVTLGYAKYPDYTPEVSRPARPFFIRTWRWDGARFVLQAARRRKR